MSKFILIIIFSLSFSIASDSIKVYSSEKLIDFQKLSLKEKVRTLKVIMNKSDKFIIYLPKYRIEVKNIISIIGDSIKVELLDNWWWNKPKQPVFNNRSPIESLADQTAASYSRVIPIEDITAIQLIKKKPLILLLLPGILVILVMRTFGL